MKRMFFALWVILGSYPLMASENLGLVFPLEQKDKQILITQPVLINPNCIVQPGAKARIIFVPSRPGEITQAKKHHSIEDNGALTRKAPDQIIADRLDTRTPEEKEIEYLAKKVVWEEEVAFRCALGQLEPEASRFVFQQPNSEQILIENFDFPEGMLLTEKGNQIVVLHVQDDSNAQKIGIRPKSILLSLNGKKFEGKLTQFQKIYAEEKKHGQETNTPLEFTFLPPQSTEPQTASLRLPPSLHSDFWSESDKKNQNSKASPTAPNSPDPSKTAAPSTQNATANP